ncbi:hypothetical protein ABT336_01620 [Micromonospora sp. NPDC000207]|uniref:hypothetical protein n=1 Tax=Micromonospora sp. NPDC000207 TaxID=3154246 RepID=UPI003319666C
MPPDSQSLDDFLSRLEEGLTGSEQARQPTAPHALTTDTEVADLGARFETLTLAAKQHQQSVLLHCERAAKPVTTTIEQLSPLLHGTISEHQIDVAVEHRRAAEEPLRAALDAQYKAQALMWETVRTIAATDEVSGNELTKYANEQVALIRDLAATTRDILRAQPSKTAQPSDGPQESPDDLRIAGLWNRSAELHRTAVRGSPVHAAGSAHRRFSARLDAIGSLRERQEEANEKLTVFSDLWLARNAAYTRTPTSPMQTPTQSSAAPTYRAFAAAHPATDQKKTRGGSSGFR